MEALGEVLAPAARAIHERTQAPEAICGQSVLAAAALSVQGFADVRLPTGAARPLSSYWVTVAGSGERKTTVDDVALQPVRDREEALAAQYTIDREEYEIVAAAWEQQRRQDLNRTKSTLAAKRAALKKLGPRPEEPLVPVLTCPEPTFEGLTKLFAAGWPCLAVATAEGGQFIGGHGMNADNRLKTAAALSSLWDGEPLKRVRAGEPPLVLPGRRLVVHLLIQPGVAAGLLSDPLIADQGLLSRILVAAPEPTSGSRFWREPSEEAEDCLVQYRDQLSTILSTPLPLAEGRRNELRPRVIGLSPTARELWIRYADHVEGHLGAGGEYESIRGFANKLAEHAARLAAVIALVGDLDLEELSEHQLARGIELATFYAEEALRLFDVGVTDPDLALAERLLRWIHSTWKEKLISLPDIYQKGPRAIRDGKAARRIVLILQEHGWLEEVDRSSVAGAKRREVWRVVRP